MSIPIGARVHHVGCLWSAHFTEEERKKNPSWGWGTVLEAQEQNDGSYEYKVQKDAPFMKGMSTVSWWAEYRINRWEVLSMTVTSANVVRISVTGTRIEIASFLEWLGTNKIYYEFIIFGSDQRYDALFQPMDAQKIIEYFSTENDSQK